MKGIWGTRMGEDEALAKRIHLLIVMVSWFLLLLSGDVTWAADLKQVVKDLADQLAKGVPEQLPMTVVVADFSNMDGTTSDFGRYLAEQLRAELVGSQRFQVVERRRVKQVLTALKFRMADLVDPAKAKQVGTMLGVNAMVMGTLFDLGSTLEIDARVIDIESGGILFGALTSLSKELAQVPYPIAKSLTQKDLTLSVERLKPLPEDQLQILLLPGGDYLLVDLVFRNASEKPMTIALAQGAKAYLLDEAGKQYRVVRLRGLIVDLPLGPNKTLRHTIVFPRPQGEPFQLLYPGFEKIEGLFVAEE